MIPPSKDDVAGLRKRLLMRAASDVQVVAGVWKVEESKVEESIDAERQLSSAKSETFIAAAEIAESMGRRQKYPFMGSEVATIQRKATPEEIAAAIRAKISPPETGT